MNDTISRQWLMECVNEGWIKFDTEKDENRFIHLVRDIAPSAQPETAKRIVGKSRDGMTLWYQCDMCNEPVDVQDNYCRGCGRRLIDERSD